MVLDRVDVEKDLLQKESPAGPNKKLKKKIKKRKWVGVARVKKIQGRCFCSVEAQAESLDDGHVFKKSSPNHLSCNNLLLFVEKSL